MESREKVVYTTILGEMNEKELAGFRGALMTHQGAKERWGELRAKGANNEELLCAIRYELGIAGGSCGPGRVRVNYTGGARPSISILDDDWNCKYVLQGKNLLLAVREYFMIGDGRQPSLF